MGASAWHCIESSLGLMHEVGVLRLPPAFGLAHAEITLTETGSVVTKSVDGGGRRVTASKAVMRSGRHFAQFTVVIELRRQHIAVTDMFFGVIQPG